MLVPVLTDAQPTESEPQISHSSSYKMMENFTYGFMVDLTNLGDERVCCFVRFEVHTPFGISRQRRSLCAYPGRTNSTGIYPALQTSICPPETSFPEGMNPNFQLNENCATRPLHNSYVIEQCDGSNTFN